MSLFQCFSLFAMGCRIHHCCHAVKHVMSPFSPCLFLRVAFFLKVTSHFLNDILFLQAMSRLCMLFSAFCDRFLPIFFVIKLKINILSFSYLRTPKPRFVLFMSTHLFSFSGNVEIVIGSHEDRKLNLFRKESKSDGGNLYILRVSFVLIH